MNKNLKTGSPTTIGLIIRFVDGISILCAAYLALLLRQMMPVPIELPASSFRFYGLALVGALMFSVISGGVYRSWRGSQMPGIMARAVGRWWLAMGLLLLCLFVFKATQEFSRIWLVLWLAMGSALLCMNRLLVYGVLRSLRRRGFNMKSVALVGGGAAATNLKERLAGSGWSGYSVALEIEAVDTLALERLAAAAVDEVWLALPLGNEQAIRDALYALRHSTAAIRFVPDLFTLRLVNHGVSDVLGMPMFDLSTSPMTGLNLVVKWLEDKVLSSVILLLISPLMLLLALGVKLSSPGPVFYRQERVGLNNRPFYMLKFRSMPIDTEKDGVQWGGSAAKATNRFGQLIRKSSLDELPQFLNVLKGDMSIVGPRPERPMFVEQFKEEIPDYMKKHLVKAGITGWAQVHGWRGDTDLKTRIEYDLYYIENWSLWLDLKIVFLTVFKGFVNKNAY